MLKTLRVAAAFAASIGLASALATPAAAQGGVNVGNLSCSVSSGWGFVFGSSRGLNCTFAGMGGRTSLRGHLEVRVDIGYTQGGVPDLDRDRADRQSGTGRSRRQLRRTTASATVGAVGANALIGGSGNTIALQPLSISGNTGLNVAGGIGAIT
jgi:hypothetical protein